MTTYLKPKPPRTAPFITHALDSAFSSQDLTPITDFVIDAEKHRTVATPAGIEFAFAPFSFAYADGMPVTRPINVAIREVRTLRDLILANLSNTHKGELLNSVSPFFISATEGDQSLSLLRPCKVRCPITSIRHYTAALHLYSEGVASICSLQGRKAFDWQRACSQPLTVERADKGRVVPFSIPALGWWDVAATISKVQTGAAMITVSCAATDYAPLSEVRAFLVLSNTQTLLPLMPDQSDFKAFNIPAGQQAFVIALGWEQGIFYYGECRIEKTCSTRVKVRMSPKALPQLLDELPF